MEGNKCFNKDTYVQQHIETLDDTNDEEIKQKSDDDDYASNCENDWYDASDLGDNAFASICNDDDCASVSNDGASNCENYLDDLFDDVAEELNAVKESDDKSQMKIVNKKNMRSLIV